MPLIMITSFDEDENYFKQYFYFGENAYFHCYRYNFTALASGALIGRTSGTDVRRVRCSGGAIGSFDLGII